VRLLARAGLLVCCGCVTAYPPGSLSASYPDAENVTLGHVEVMVQPYVSKETFPAAVMLEFRLGNDGEQSVAIDFTALEVQLNGAVSTPFDPDQQLRVAWLGPRGAALERIIYRSRSSADPAEVCLRFHHFVAGVPDETRRCFHVENRWLSQRW